MKKFHLLLLVLVLPLFSSAANQIGGYISVKHMSGLTYQIIFVDYTNYCDSLIPDQDTMRVYYGDGTSDLLTRSNGKGDSVCTCTRINLYTNSPDGVTGGHTFPGNGSYHIYINTGNRAPNINNIPSSTNQSMVIFHTINIESVSGDSVSSPIITNPPICSYGCTENCYTFNLAASGGDSLVYSLGCCLNSSTCVSGYSIPSKVNINSSTGQLNWCNPDSLGLYNFSIRITEYTYAMIGGKTIAVAVDTEEVELQVNIEANCPAGINEITNTNNFLIFPNPSNGSITLKSSEIPPNSVVQIYNVLGEKIYEKLISQKETSISLNNSNAGIYLYKVITETGNVVSEGKFVLEK